MTSFWAMFRAWGDQDAVPYSRPWGTSLGSMCSKTISSSLCSARFPHCAPTNRPRFHGGLATPKRNKSCDRSTAAAMWASWITPWCNRFTPKARGVTKCVRFNRRISIKKYIILKNGRPRECGHQNSCRPAPTTIKIWMPPGRDADLRRKFK